LGATVEEIHDDDIEHTFLPDDQNILVSMPS
jgi:hypothetical protein